MKNYTHSISVLKGTNKIITSSEVNLKGLREGSYIRIGNDHVFYIVSKVSPLLYVKDFEVENARTIKIKDNIGINVLTGDTLTLSHKEYKLYTLFGITNGGKGYKKDDILTVEGGVLLANLETNIKELASFIVTNVDAHGTILEVGINVEGKYIEPPKSTCSLIGGSGDGAVFEVDFNVADQRNLLERKVSSYEVKNDCSLVRLDYPLPEGLKTGKMSIKKWQAEITNNYGGDSQRDINYEIARDFTPIYNFPTLVKGSFNQELIINRFISLVDQKFDLVDKEINLLKEKIKELEEKQPSQKIKL